MYAIVLVGLVAAGIWLGIYGARRRNFAMAGAGILLAVASGVFGGLPNFWGEILWFEAMGCGRRFWEAVWVQAFGAFPII